MLNRAFISICRLIFLKMKNKLDSAQNLAKKCNANNNKAYIPTFTLLLSFFLTNNFLKQFIKVFLEKIKV